MVIEPKRSKAFDKIEHKKLSKAGRPARQLHFAVVAQLLSISIIFCLVAMSNKLVVILFQQRRHLANDLSCKSVDRM